MRLRKETERISGLSWNTSSLHKLRDQELSPPPYDVGEETQTGMTPTLALLPPDHEFRLNGRHTIPTALSLGPQICGYTKSLY